jgi:hypothetical protein
MKAFSIFSNLGHLEWSSDLSDTIQNGDQPRTIAAKLCISVLKVHPYSFAVSFLYTQCYILATTLILVENLTLTNAFAFLKLRFASS